MLLMELKSSLEVGAGSLSKHIIGQDIRFLGGRPDDWPNKNAHIFLRHGTIFVKMMSHSSEGLKLEPDVLCSHGHLFDTIPTTVICKKRSKHNPKCVTVSNTIKNNTDMFALSETGYSDSLLSVTLLANPMFP